MYKRRSAAHEHAKLRKDVVDSERERQKTSCSSSENTPSFNTLEKKKHKSLHSADDGDDDNDDDNTHYYRETENKNERESEGSDSSTITPPASSDLERAKIKIPLKKFLSFSQPIYLMYSNSKNGVHQTPSHSSTAGMPAYSRIIVSRLMLGTLPSNVQDYNTSTATQLLHRRYGIKQAGSARTSDKKQQQ
jgi:hypothetical protein